MRIRSAHPRLRNSFVTRRTSQRFVLSARAGAGARRAYHQDGVVLRVEVFLRVIINAVQQCEATGEALHPGRFERLQCERQCELSDGEECTVALDDAES